MNAKVVGACSICGGLVRETGFGLSCGACGAVADLPIIPMRPFYSGPAFVPGPVYIPGPVYAPTPEPVYVGPWRSPDESWRSIIVSDTVSGTEPSVGTWGLA